jgi:hypothetical protein
MKKTVLLTAVILLLSISTSFGQIRNTIDLLGIWTSNQLRVEFIDNAKVSIVFTGNKKQFGTYTSDFLLTPHTLEMSFTGGDKQLAFKCLIQFLDNNTLKWESFSKTDHPRNFTRSFSLLKKVKN